jgi:type VI protein secretion system component Hcp
MKASKSGSARRAIQVAIAASLASGSAFAVDDVFLRMSGLTGESTDGKHPGWSDALSFTQSASAKNCPKFVVSKYVDSTTAALAAAAANGEPYPAADLVIQGTDAKGATYDYYTIKMSNVVVYSSQQRASSGDPRATEEIVLAPGTVSISYRTATGTSYVSSYSCKGG